MSDRPLPEPADDLLAATPATAYLWGRIAGDGRLDGDRAVVRTADAGAARACGAVAGVDVDPERARETTARESAHDAAIVRYDDEYELRLPGVPAARAAAAFGLPRDGDPGGYRLDALADEPALLRGLFEACGTVCFRESAGSVGLSFVHDESLLRTVRGLLADAPPALPTGELSPASAGGHWFGLADGADVAGFAAWLYEGSDASGLYSDGRRAKLRRSGERATGREVGTL